MHAFWGEDSVYITPTIRWPQILLAHRLTCCDGEQRPYAMGVQFLLNPNTVLYSQGGVGSVLQLEEGGDLPASQASNLSPENVTIS